MAGADDALVGPWALVSHRYTTGSGTVVHPFGEHPVGTLLYTEDGYMGAQLVQVDSLPPGSTQNEQSFSATWRPSAGGFTFDIVASADPSAVGSTNRRTTTIDPGPPATLLIEWTQDDRAYHVVWRRLESTGPT